MSTQSLRRGAATGQGETGGGEGRIPPPSTNLLAQAIRLIVKDGADDDGQLWCRTFPTVPPDVAEAIDWCLEENDQQNNENDYQKGEFDTHALIPTPEQVFDV